MATRKKTTTVKTSSNPLSTKQQATSFNSATSRAAKIKSITDQASKIQSSLNSYKSNPKAAKSAGFSGINRENDFDEVEAQLAQPQVPQPQMQTPLKTPTQTFGVNSVGDLAGGMNNGAYSYDNEELYGDVASQYFTAGASKSQADALARSTMSKAKAGELPFQTYERLTGKRWAGGSSPEVFAMLTQYGIQEAPGSAIANLKLQQALTGTSAVPTLNPGSLGLPATTNFTMPQLEQDMADGIPSTALGSTVTGEDIFTKINTMLDASIKTQEALAGKREQLRTLETQALQQITNNRGEIIPLGLIGQQEQNIRENLAFRQIPLTNEIQSLTDQLEIDQKNISLAVELQKLTKPDVIGTKVNEETGEVYAFMQDQATGKVTTKTVGNVGAKAAKKDYITSHYYRDANNNEVFWGMTADGKVETKVLGRSGVGTGGDGGGDGLTVGQKNTLADYLEDVGTYDNRAAALADLQKDRNSIVTQVGQSGYNQILSEVDIQFPATKSSLKTPGTAAQQQQESWLSRVTDYLWSNNSNE